MSLCTKLGNFVSLLLIAVFLQSSVGKVLELSDRFLDVSKEGMWLVKFYAPWCGHCKRLEPVWNQVAQSLHYSNVRVGRVDCTRFSSVALEFNVHGFPTILFLKGEKIYSYRGDRNREDIVEFALRLESSAVRNISSQDEFERMSSKHSVYFLLIAEDDDASELKMYYEVATTFQPHAYFYVAQNKSVSENMREKASDGSTIYVVKDGMHLPFQPLKGDRVNDSLSAWVNRERFSSFIKVTQGSLPELLKADRLLAISVLNENAVGQLTPEMKEFCERLKHVATVYKEEFKTTFLFGWTPSASLANSLALQNLPIPSLIVLNTSSYQHYLPDDDVDHLTSDTIVEFFRQILRNSAKAYGGNGIFTRIYRVYYDATTTLLDMWFGNPVLTTVLFGLPFGFLLLICYSICCADILDASDDDDDKLDDLHEKKE